MTDGKLLFALPQCGSKRLTAVLGAHPGLRCFNEPFNPEVPDPTGRRMPSPTMSQLDAVLHGVWESWPVIEHVWDPAGWPFPRHSPHNGHVLLTGSHVLLLSRRNLLQLAVEYAVALQRAAGAADPAISPATAAPVPLDVDAVKWQLKQIPPALRTHRRVLYVRNRKWLDMEYEDLFDRHLDSEARAAALDRVFEFFGHSVHDDGVDQDGVRQFLESEPANEADGLRTIPNIEEIERQLGSDETGWLLRSPDR